MPLELPSELMVGVSGFRGRVGASLTPELVAGLAARFGDFLRGEGEDGPVVVGRDSRTSGPMLERAAVSGLQSAGVDVVLLGIVPTPTLVLAARDAGAAGGLGVTASHNPAEWNALKFVSGDGIFIDREGMERYLERLASEEPARAAWDELGEVRADEGAIDRHVNRILGSGPVDVEAIRGLRLRVAVDCVHGAGGRIVPALLERLGCEVVGIGLEPDGLFPRDPEPTADHLGELGELVLEEGAAIGFALDPDVDRLSIVDETGRPVGEELTLALAADVVLSRTPGPVVTNLSTSRTVEDVAAAHGSSVLRVPVGEVNVARSMQEISAVVGGEGNGGVIFPAVHYTRDAPLGMALVLQHLVDTAGSASHAVARWPEYEIVKEKVAFPREALERAFEALADDLEGGETDRQDGLRLEWKDRRSWLHVRPSGTEPVVRLIAETPAGAGASQLVARARAVLEGVA